MTKTFVSIMLSDDPLFTLAFPTPLLPLTIEGPQMPPLFRLPERITRRNPDLDGMLPFLCFLRAWGARPALGRGVLAPFAGLLISCHLLSPLTTSDTQTSTYSPSTGHSSATSQSDDPPSTPARPTPLPLVTIEAPQTPPSPTPPERTTRRNPDVTAGL